MIKVSRHLSQCQRASKIRIIIISFLFFFVAPILTEASSDKHGGQLVFAVTSDPKSFNDILIKETTSGVVTSLLFEGLTTTNAFTSKVEPHLAKSWDVSEDGREWTFHLRRDVTWHDGHPLTADDVVFTFKELIYNPDIPSSARDIFTIEGKEFDIQKVDDHTVKFILPSKFAPFLRGMTQSILPKHKLKKHVDDGTFNHTWGIDTDPKEIIGTGYFKFVRYDPGQRMIFERNPNYWKTDGEGNRLPYLNKIIYLIVQNADVALLKFLEGSTDSIGLRGTDYPYLKPKEKDGDFTIFNLGPDSGSQFIFFNQNTGSNPESQEPYVDPVKSRWFTNLEFRKAVAHSIDKTKIIEIIKNRLGFPQYSAVGPAAGFFHNPDVVKYDFDLNKARTILTNAGFTDRDNDGYIEDPEGNRVEFSLYTSAGGGERENLSSIIRHDLEQLGMKVNFKAIEFNILVSKLTSSFDWEAVVLGLTGGVEPHFGMNVWHSSGQLHMWYPKQETPATEWEKRIDELFVLGVQELDEDKRKEYYDEYQVIVSEKLPLIYTVLGSNLRAVRNRFGNLKPSNIGGVFHNLEEIYINDK